MDIYDDGWQCKQAISTATMQSSVIEQTLKQKMLKRR